MADFDETNPGDSDIVSQYPANARAARAAVKTNFGIDHQEVDGADVGKHQVIQILDNTVDPTITAGQVGVWNNGAVLKTRAGAGAVNNVATEAYVNSQIAGSAFAAGTKMVFFQAAAPTGWTQDASVNDQVLRVVSTAGGGSGGSWTLSGVSVNSHTLTTTEIPAHNHSGSTGSAGSHNHSASTGSAGSHSHSFTVETGTSNSGTGIERKTEGSSSTSFSTNSAGAHTHSVSVGTVADHTHSVSIGNTGGGAGHTHGLTADGSWRPAYINVMVCTKD